MRRWPREEDRIMTEGISGEITDWYHGGKALNLQKARIIIGDQEQTKVIEPDMKGVTFTFSLKAGITHLQTFLSDNEELELGAYYVYVTSFSSWPANI